MKPDLNLDSCDYDVETVGNYDERFEKSKKGALFLHVLGAVGSIAGTCWMFYFGTGDPDADDLFSGFSALVFRGGSYLHCSSCCRYVPCVEMGGVSSYSEGQ